MILVDTSVWIHHFRTGSEQLQSLLSEEQVFCHPFIAGELACGTLRNRHEILTLLGALPQARVLEHDEVLHFLDGRRLYGRGLGWIDVHILASALLTGCALWSLDGPLLRAAATLNLLE
ncbi:type II toxin-antitoxin system VapC family toxin [Nitrospira sp. Nam80]